VRFAALPAVAAAGDGSAPAPALPQTPGAPRPLTPFMALVGDEYYTAKEQLILDEQARCLSAVWPAALLLSLLCVKRWLPAGAAAHAVWPVALCFLCYMCDNKCTQVLLRTLRFELIAEQPHRYLLNFCHVLHASHAVTKLATCLARAPPHCGLALCLDSPLPLPCPLPRPGRTGLMPDTALPAPAACLAAAHAVHYKTQVVVSARCNAGPACPALSHGPKQHLARASGPHQYCACIPQKGGPPRR
jgi:hypothetical protein